MLLLLLLFLMMVAALCPGIPLEIPLRGELLPLLEHYSTTAKTPPASSFIV